MVCPLTKTCDKVGKPLYIFIFTNPARIMILMRKERRRGGEERGEEGEMSRRVKGKV